MSTVRYLPEWMPGADFKKTARLWKATLMEMAERPMQFVRKQMADNRHPPSYVSTLYEKVRAEGTVTQDDEDLIKWTAASMYAAGADTVRENMHPTSLPLIAKISRLTTTPPMRSPLASWPSSSSA